MSMLVETSIENLIEEIEKRPALYKKQLKEYSDINLKKKLWEEVCEVVIPDWNELGAQEKTKQGHEAQKKWANLRTCFRRELNAQKNTKSGQAATKRRKYVYFEKLLFLLPCMENRRTEGNLEPNDSHEDEDDNNDTGPTTSTPIPHRKKRTNVSKPDELDEALIKALNQSRLMKIQTRRFETSSQSTSSYNVLQRPLSYPVYHPGSNIMPPPQLSQHSNYTSSFTTLHSLPLRFKTFKILHRQKILMIQAVGRLLASLRTHHQPNCLVGPVCAIVAQPD
ncbi:hypothetical protein QTP88_011876 [Uroleucon formosanum]